MAGAFARNNVKAVFPQDLYKKAGFTVLFRLTYRHLVAIILKKHSAVRI